VGSETKTWQEGKCIVFDDTTEHEAWNKGDKTRVVLLLDFKPNTGNAEVSEQPQEGLFSSIRGFFKNLGKK
jgi:beta-hydroxylase